MSRRRHSPEVEAWIAVLEQAARLAHRYPLPAGIAASVALGALVGWLIVR